MDRPEHKQVWIKQPDFKYKENEENRTYNKAIDECRAYYKPIIKALEDDNCVATCQHVADLEQQLKAKDEVIESKANIGELEKIVYPYVSGICKGNLLCKDLAQAVSKWITSDDVEKGE